VNTKEYIESGIIEQYVLDALTPEERLGVEQLMAQYPEIAAEVEAVQEGLLSFAAAGAVQPPVALKEKIWDSIVQQHSAIEIVQDRSHQEVKDNVRPLPPQKPAMPTWQRAAIWAAVLVSVLTNFLLLSQKNQLRDEQAELLVKVDSIRAQQQYLASVVDNYNKERELLADTSMQAVVMKTMQPGHPMAATVYWSRGEGSAYLSIQKMPMPPAGKQYQLWVIQDGKPVSMGVISNDLVSAGSVHKLPMSITSGQAFAISLEQSGGSESPTMEQIQVLGKPS